MGHESYSLAKGDWIDTPGTRFLTHEDLSFQGPFRNDFGWTEIDGVRSYTHFKPEDVLTPERQALHDTFIEERLDGVLASDEPTFTLTSGGPASGKSTVLDGELTFDPHSTIVVNPDDVKHAFTEYDHLRDVAPERAVDVMHQESAMVAARLQREAIDAGADVIRDTTGSGPYGGEMGFKAIVERWSDGRPVVMHHVTLDTDVALARAEARALLEGRHIDPDYLVRAHAESASNVVNGLRDGLFDELTIWDNNGTAPVKIAELVDTPQGRMLEVHDEAAFDRFLTKAAPDGHDPVTLTRLDELRTPVGHAEPPGPSLDAPAPRAADELSPAEQIHQARLDDANYALPGPVPEPASPKASAAPDHGPTPHPEGPMTTNRTAAP